MNPRDYFTLGLRLFGVWQLIDTVEFFFTTFTIVTDLYHPTTASPGYWMLATFVHFFLAVWLLKFAPATARFFYPDRSPDPDSN